MFFIRISSFPRLFKFPILRMSTSSSSSASASVTNLVSYLNSSPSHFHAVRSSSAQLKAAGFQQIREIDTNWNEIIKPNGKYFLTRNQSALIAFSVGGNYKSGNGFIISGAHTDSPVLKLKPVSKVVKSGFLEVGVEVYGGGLWYTWFDRDLSVAGRVVVRGSDGSFDSRLLAIHRPILRIPSLAIHLNREVNDKGFAPNKQTHLVPILASQIKVALEYPAAAEAKAAEAQNSLAASHHSLLLKLLSEELKVPVDSIVDFELSLFDVQPACLGGALSEFIFARGLDNLCMSFVTIQGLIDATADSEILKSQNQIQMASLFDNEEVGSDSFMGAGSTFLNNLLHRLNAIGQQGNSENNNNIDSALRKSLLISADMAHGVHPNYPECHEENHRPVIHGGLVIKSNANMRYATSNLTAMMLEQLANDNGIKVQKFCVRNDTGCGSTIGPILATNCSLRVVDVGIPQLSMHSIREQCGTDDVESSIKLFKIIFQQLKNIDDKLKMEGEQ